jgi:hypothetical protein
VRSKKYSIKENAIPSSAKISPFVKLAFHTLTFSSMAQFVNSLVSLKDLQQI